MVIYNLFSYFPSLYLIAFKYRTNVNSAYLLFEPERSAGGHGPAALTFQQIDPTGYED